MWWEQEKLYIFLHSRWSTVYTGEHWLNNTILSCHCHSLLCSALSWNHSWFLFTWALKPTIILCCRSKKLRLYQSLRETSFRSKVSAILGKCWYSAWWRLKTYISMAEWPVKRFAKTCQLRRWNLDWLLLVWGLAWRLSQLRSFPFGNIFIIKSKLYSVFLPTSWENTGLRSSVPRSHIYY